MKQGVIINVVGMILILLVAHVWSVLADGMGTGLGLGLGSGGVEVGPPSECGVGYDALTGSDSNVIHDKDGKSICCPQ